MYKLTCTVYYWVTCLLSSIDKEINRTEKISSLFWAYKKAESGFKVEKRVKYFGVKLMNINSKLFQNNFVAAWNDIKHEITCNYPHWTESM